ncbi:MAG: type II toxin-antitoxin system VapC family toxin [Patescibacteria group bacterium]
MKDSYKPLYIIDSSVLIKLIEKEEDQEKAFELMEKFFRKKIDLGIPSLAYYEVTNYFSRRHPFKSILFFSQILMLKMTEFFVTLENIARTIDITQKFPKTAFYDATYHALAIQHDGTFITADENYYKKAKSLKHIQLLKDYKD